MQRTSKHTAQIKKLEDKIASLEAELNKRDEHRTIKVNWRRISKWLSLGMLGGLLAAGSILFYVGLSLTNTDRFMNIVSPMIKQPAIQQAIATEATNKLYEQVDTKEILVENLPPKLQFLAPQLAEQVQNLTKEKAEEVLANQSFQNIWDNTLRTVHKNLIGQLENYEGNGTISINDIYQQLSRQLSSGTLSFLAGKQLPSKVGSITVIQSDYLPTARSVVANITTAHVLALVLLLLLATAVILLSKTKRQGIIHIGLAVGLVSFALLISLRVVGLIIGNNVQPEFSAATKEAWRTIIDPYRTQLITQSVFGFALAMVAWLGGQTRNASRLRGSFNELLEGRFHQAIFKNGETNTTKWFAKHKRLLIGATAVGFVFSLALIPIGLASVSLAITITILIIVAVSLIAAPTKR